MKQFFTLFHTSKNNADFSYFRPFADINNKAIEEVWYKRAVDYHIKDPKAFVYSVPFDVGKKKTQVTASHAIMVGKGNQKSPAAVAGMQIGKENYQLKISPLDGVCLKIS